MDVNCVGSREIGSKEPSLASNSLGMGSCLEFLAETEAAVFCPRSQISPGSVVKR